MTTVKSFTDKSQGIALRKILSIESADMHYQYVLPKSDKIKHNPEIGNPVNALEWYNKGYTTFGKEPITLNEYCIPCWSLAALFSVLPHIQEFYPTLEKINDKYVCRYKSSGIWTNGNNPLDACYEMILKLHEQKIL